MASVLRRMDDLARDRKIRAETEGQLLALATSIAANCSVEHNRLLRLATHYTREDGLFAQRVQGYLGRRRSDEDASSLFVEMLAALDTSGERQLLALRLRGASHALIATCMGISADAVRQRWSSIRAKLVDRVDWGHPDGAL